MTFKLTAYRIPALCLQPLWGLLLLSKNMSRLSKDGTKLRHLEACSSISSHCVCRLYSVLGMKLLLSPTCARYESVLLSAWPHFLVLPTACVDTYMSSWEPDLLKMHAWTAMGYVSCCPDWVVLFSLGCFCYVQREFGVEGGCPVGARVVYRHFLSRASLRLSTRSVRWQLIIPLLVSASESLAIWGPGLPPVLPSSSVTLFSGFTGTSVFFAFSWSGVLYFSGKIK